MAVENEPVGWFFCKLLGSLRDCRRICPGSKGWRAFSLIMPTPLARSLAAIRFWAYLGAKLAENRGARNNEDPRWQQVSRAISSLIRFIANRDNNLVNSRQL